MIKKSVEIERKAIMNTSAVTEAKVYKGRVHYYCGKHIDLDNTTLVEVGKWTAEGQEHSPEDYLCTYYAAVLLGYKPDWLPYNKEGDRKLLIGAGRNENEEVVSFSEEKATRIACAINQVYNLAKSLQTVLI